jgi:hypothetical protein
MRDSSRFLALSATFICTFAAAGAGADWKESTKTELGRWHYEITPYFFLPGVTATSILGPTEVDIDLSFADIWNNFDVFALSGRAEAWRKKRFGLYLDGQGIGLKTDVDAPRPGEKIGVDMGLTIIDLGVGFRLFDTELGGRWRGHQSRILADFLVSARYTELSQEVFVSGFALEAGGTSRWWDAQVGGRIAVQLTDRIPISVRGSYGGFDAAGRRDRSWEVLAGLGYRFTDLFELRAGYKIYSLDYLEGAGRSRFGFDGDFQGLWLGLTFHLGDRGSVKDSKRFI